MLNILLVKHYFWKKKLKTNETKIVEQGQVQQIRDTWN